MKKTLLVASLGIIITGAFSQSGLVPAFKQKAQVPANIANIVQTMKCPAYKNELITDVFKAEVSKTGHSDEIKTMANTQSYNIGWSSYQLQTNASNRDALIKHADGTISTVWTQLLSSQNTVLRGTGYNYYNGTSWGTKPTSRIETQRTGWPSIAVTASGKEVIISHNTDADKLQLSYRAAKGTGSWTHNTTAIPGPTAGGNVWPRIVSGGADGNSLHVLSVTQPTGLGGVKYNKQNGCLTYCRSTDDGATWDKIHYVNTLHDSAAEYTSIGGDNYAIDAKGNTVAYVVGSPTTDLILVKSTDNGSNWSKTTINDFPIPFYVDQITDINGDTFVDTIYVNDGVYSIALDNAGNAHVTYGVYRMFNSNSTDSTYNYYPYSSLLVYWNESMATDSSVVIGYLADLNGDNSYAVPTGNPNSGQYIGGAISHSSIAIDANNDIFVAFDEVCDANDDGNGKAYRNVFVTGSSDGGATWTPIIRASDPDGSTGGGQGIEQVYPSAAKRVDNCFSFIFQEDAAPGHGVSNSTTTPNPDEAINAGVEADMVYNCFDVLDIVSISEKSKKDFFISDVYPNPFNDNASITLGMNTAGNISVEIFNTVGQKVRSIAPRNYGVGNHTITVEKGNLTQGLYLLTIRSGASVISKRIIVE